MNGKTTSVRTSQLAYRTFMQAQGAQLPLFFQPWWLDIVCGGAKHWDAVLAYDGQHKVLAVLPFAWRKRWGIRFISTPPLTPCLGPWLFYPDHLTTAKRSAFEQRVLPQLIDQIPASIFFRIKCHPRVTNWLPFYWKGYRQTTRYTFQLRLGDGRKWLSERRYKVRHAIKQAGKANFFDPHPNPETCYSLLEKTFAAKGIRVPFSQSLFFQLDGALAERGCRSMYFARDAGGEAYAVVYLAQDALSSYALFIASDPQRRPYGTVHWLFAQVFECLQGQEQVFDFEGSMLPGVARLFSDLGGQPVPYFELHKGRNHWVGRAYALFQR